MKSNQNNRKDGAQSKMTPSHLSEVAAAFDDRTRIVETTVRPKEGVWDVVFNNGYAVQFRSDGTWEVTGP